MPNELMAILARRRKTIDDAAQAGILSLELAPPVVIAPSEAPKSWTKNILKVKKPTSPRAGSKSPRSPRSPKAVKATPAAAVKAPITAAALAAAVAQPAAAEASVPAAVPAPIAHGNAAAAVAEAEQSDCSELLQQLSALQPSFALPAPLFEQACTLCRSALLLAVAERAYSRVLTVLRAASAVRSIDVTRQKALCAMQLQQSAELSAAFWEALLKASLSSLITDSSSSNSSSSSSSQNSTALAPEELRRVTVISAVTELAAVIGELQLPANVLKTLAAFAAQHYSVHLSLNDDVYSPLPAQMLLWLLRAHCSSYSSSSDSNRTRDSSSGAVAAADSSSVAAGSSSSSSSGSHQQRSIEQRLTVGAPQYELVKRAVQHHSRYSILPTTALQFMSSVCLLHSTCMRCSVLAAYSSAAVTLNEMMNTCVLIKAA
jgi:hypothetical protein